MRIPIDEQDKQIRRKIMRIPIDEQDKQTKEGFEDYFENTDIKDNMQTEDILNNYNQTNKNNDINNTNNNSNKSSDIKSDRSSEEDIRLRQIANEQDNYKRNEQEIRNVNQTYNNSPQNVGERKTGIGFLCAFFLGLIGLLIGYFIYKENGKEYEWKTFLRGWTTTFIVTIILSIIIGIIYYISVVNLVNDSLNQYYDILNQF